VSEWQAGDEVIDKPSGVKFVYVGPDPHPERTGAHFVWADGYGCRSVSDWEMERPPVPSVDELIDGWDELIDRWSEEHSTLTSRN